MKLVPFEDLYYTDFTISEPLAKPQNWYERKNIYSCLGKPKPSHTLLWFKNCSGKITDKSGKTLFIKKNQLAYMVKGLEYIVEFFETEPNQVDSIVFHFQLTDTKGDDICPAASPKICIKDVDMSLGLAIDMASEEFKKNLVCVPEITSVIYRIFAHICKNRRSTIVNNKYSYIRAGIDLLENNSNKTIEEIAKVCGVSEGYFRRLFREYSGDNPIDFRQKRRIEKAKQMLLLDTFSIEEIALELHFSDIYHFSKSFKKYCGISPNKYLQNMRKQNNNDT